MFATIIFDLTQAIVIGVLLACILFMVKISNMEISISDVDTDRLDDDINDTGCLENIKIAYFTGPLFFATIEKFNAQLEEFEHAGILILSMRGVPLIDTSGIQALEELYLTLNSRGSKLMLCGLQPHVSDMIYRSNLKNYIGKDMIFWDAKQAIAAAQEKEEESA
jgi:SulP family sulfate permease